MRESDAWTGNEKFRGEHFSELNSKVERFNQNFGKIENLDEKLDYVCAKIRQMDVVRNSEGRKEVYVKMPDGTFERSLDRFVIDKSIFEDCGIETGKCGDDECRRRISSIEDRMGNVEWRISSVGGRLEMFENKLDKILNVLYK